MTKKELVKAAAAAAGITQDKAEAVLNATLKAIAQALTEGDKVKLQGFGTLEPRQHRGKAVFDFATGEQRKGKPYTCIGITTAPALKERMTAAATARECPQDK